MFTIIFFSFIFAVTKILVILVQYVESLNTGDIRKLNKPESRIQIVKDRCRNKRTSKTFTYAPNINTLKEEKTALEKKNINRSKAKEKKSQQ